MNIVYLYTNLMNDKVYVGQTNNPVRRDKAHHVAAQRRNTPFYAAVRKHGWGSFYKLEIPVDSAAQMDNLEKLWIAVLGTTRRKFGYNLDSGGTRPRRSPETVAKIVKSRSGYRHSEETKRKISAAKLGTRLSEETRRKLGERHRVNGDRPPSWSGKRHKPETLAKMRVSATRYWTRREFSEEHRRNIGLAGLGKKQRPEWIQRRVESRKRTMALRRDSPVLR